MSRAVAFHILCRCLAENGSETLGEDIRRAAQSGTFQWETFLALARDGLIVPALSSLIHAKGVEEAFPKHIAGFLDGVAHLNRLRNERLRTEAIAVTMILNKAGVTPVILKGGANLLSGLYGDPAQRIMVDLDLLVPAQSVLDCAAALRRHGYEELLDNGFPAHHHYPPLSRRDGIASVELHVETLDLPYRRLLPAGEVFESAMRLDVGKTTLSVPSPQLRMVHTIAHAQLSNHDYIYGRFSLRDYFDFALLRTAFAREVNWSLLRRRFANCRASTALGFHLLAAQRLLGVPIDPAASIDVPAKLACRRASWQIDHPDFLNLGEGWLGLVLLLRRSLSTPSLRTRLRHNLLDPEWYRRWWRMLRR